MENKLKSGLTQMTSKFYTGIGSRETPFDVLELMTRVARGLSAEGFILRSGGAAGADSAFEAGCGPLGEIWIPWNGFNGKSTGGIHQIIPESILCEAEILASSIHPAWGNCRRGARTLHTRNILQVLGADLNTPSKFLVCWSIPNKEGDATGGTATAWNLAKRNKIPCYNLFFDMDRMVIEDGIKAGTLSDL